MPSEPDQYIIELPPPEPALSPNARVHWAKKSDAKRLYRNQAHLEALKVLDGRVPLWERAKLSIAYYHPARRMMDSDNILASMKSAIDGLADAELIRDDSGLEIGSIKRLVDKDNPRILLFLEKLDA